MNPEKSPISHIVPHSEQQQRIRALCERLLDSQQRSISLHPSRPTTARNYVRPPSSSSSALGDDNHHYHHLQPLGGVAVTSPTSDDDGFQQHHGVLVPSSAAPSATPTPREGFNRTASNQRILRRSISSGRVVDVRPHSAAATKASGEEVLSSLSREEVMAALPRMRLIGRYPPLVSVIDDDDDNDRRPSYATTTTTNTAAAASSSICRNNKSSKTAHEEYSPATFVARGGQVLTSIALQRHLQQCQQRGRKMARKQPPYSRDDADGNSEEEDLSLYNQHTREKEYSDDLPEAASTSSIGGRHTVISLWCTDVIPPVVKSTLMEGVDGGVGGAAPLIPFPISTTVKCIGNAFTLGRVHGESIDDDDDDDHVSMIQLYSHRSATTNTSVCGKSRSSSLVVDRNVEPYLHRGSGGSHNVLAVMSRVETSTPPLRPLDTPPSEHQVTVDDDNNIERNDQEMESVSIHSLFTSRSSVPHHPIPPQRPSTPTIGINQPEDPPPPREQEEHHMTEDDDALNTTAPVTYEPPPLPTSTPAFPTRRRAAIGAAINTIAFMMYGFVFALESSYTSIILSMVPILLSVITLLSVRSDIAIMKESAIYFFTSKLLMAQRDSQIVNPGGQASMSEEAKERIKMIVREVSDHLIIHPHFELEEGVILSVMRAWQERTPGLGYGAWAVSGTQNLCGLPLQCVRLPAVVFSAHNLSMANAVMSVITAVTSIYFFLAALMKILGDHPPSLETIVFYNSDAERRSSDYPWVARDNSDVLSMMHRSFQLVLPPLCVVLLALESRALGFTASEGLDCLVSRNQSLLQRMLAALSEARTDDALGGGSAMVIGARPTPRHRNGGVGGGEYHGPDEEGGSNDGSDHNDDNSSISSSESAHSTSDIDTVVAVSAPREVTTPPPPVATRSPSPNNDHPPPPTHRRRVDESDDNTDDEEQEVASDLCWEQDDDHVVIGRPPIFYNTTDDDDVTEEVNMGLQSHVPIFDAHIHPDNHLISTAAKQRMMRMREQRRQRQMMTPTTTTTMHGTPLSHPTRQINDEGPTVFGSVKTSDSDAEIPPQPIHPYDRILHTFVFSGAVPLATDNKDKLHNRRHHSSVDVATSLTPSHDQPTAHRKHRPLSATRALRRIYGGGKGRYY